MGRNNKPMVTVEFQLPEERATKLHKLALELGYSTKTWPSASGLLSAEIVDVWLSERK